MKTCSVLGCGKQHYGRGYCSGHWQRFRKTGNTDPETPLSRASKGQRNGNWNGGTVIEPSGRVLLYTPGHPNTMRGVYVYRYRLVMEAHLGRYLLPDEIVHHKNGICNDDRLENLEITNRSEHATRHIKERMADKWAFRFDHCVECETTATPHQARGLCERCYMKRLRKRLKRRA